MKKAIPIVLGIFLLGLGIFLVYEFATEPKIVEGVTSKAIDDKGRPSDITNLFTQGETVYFSAKRNRFWTNEAEVVWYKGEIKQENRFLVEEEVLVNDAKYFTAELSVPEGLEEGHYGVTIYVKGKKIMETHAEFDVKK
ncbi:hypothetical protein B857_03514 [Solibacillus isronensis B3W22]|uniref:Uncharacterized protein n=1 Tax=Solibacillus isronensis B3W22 TaxID=1224748 RepID=K1KMD5_9BACL|nr:hypothetical protein [Solibacillus isronensis]AMO85115.1 hypothetical protein SOLI23_05805 [Solibacillus silvestris]EKB43676.1 hypothetical protein B857_03514 [Solibacillus isronensis B3W22]